MAAQKPSIPKGTRDFTPDIMVKRNYIFDTIKSVFRLYGFLPIETPAMENLSTLLGKYGDEGDKLLFKILNSGDFLSKIPAEMKSNIVGDNINLNELTNKISEKGLRYDLTVPFARFVVQHANEISFPFRRYQIQPVWRADRPQKGRYREFYQCDADIVGSDSLINEIELLQIIDDVFARLNINVIIKLNNRKILSGIAYVIGEHENITAITVAIDKLDKIGIDKVKEEMATNGVNAAAIEKISPILSMPSDNIENTISFLKDFLASSETGLKGIEEMEYIIGHYHNLGLKTPLELDITLARGLNYYTGAIIEVKAADVQIGSISGGGRYDDLTGIFGMQGLSGVGISFGADRIFDVMTQLNNFPESSQATTKVMFVNFGEKEASHCIKLIQQLRNAGINTEIYPDAAKMKKQMTYANNRGVEYVAMVGENEINNREVTVKNMVTGEQVTISEKELISCLEK